MKIKWFKKIFSDGNHNAFTGLAFFEGKYYLCFRNGTGHASNESFQIIMTSSDGEKWNILQKNLMKNLESITVDYRDSYFLPLKDKLFLYSCCTPVDNDGKRGKSYTQLQTISRSSQCVHEPQTVCRDIVLWKPIKVENTFYAAGYGKDHSGNYEIDFYVSEDGLNWEKQSHISEGSETVLYSSGKDSLTAFVRTEASPYHLKIFQSNKPFEKWIQISEIPQIIQGFHIIETGNKVYLIGRERPDYMETADKNNPSLSRHRTKIWLFENNGLAEVLELPSLGDNAYPGTALMPDGTLLISYYSQHECGGGEWRKEMPADIFLAAVEI
ncbi:MAG: hypothetical protein WC082_05100 [Victivallales bacterium]